MEEGVEKERDIQRVLVTGEEMCLQCSQPAE